MKFVARLFAVVMLAIAGATALAVWMAGQLTGINLL